VSTVVVVPLTVKSPVTIRFPLTVPPPLGTDGVPLAKEFAALSIKFIAEDVRSYNLLEVDCPAEVTVPPVMLVDNFILWTPAAKLNA